MASLRIFTRSKLSSILQNCRHPELQKTTAPVVLKIQKRWGSYQSSPLYVDPSKYTDFEITTDPKEWQYVERLLPYKVVPLPPTTEITACGWKPQNVKEKNLPYFLPRTRNYMQPVFLRLSKRNVRKLTCITKIQGDIWQFESDLKEYLQTKIRRPVASRISEPAAVVTFHGDHVSATKEWLDSKGF